MSGCPECRGTDIRTFSHYNEKDERWEWMKGCNNCDWQSVDKQEETLHPEYYERSETSPAKINNNDIQIHA